MGEKSGPKVSFVIGKIRYMGIRSTERRLYLPFVWKKFDFKYLPRLIMGKRDMFKKHRDFDLT